MTWRRRVVIGATISLFALAGLVGVRQVARARTFQLFGRIVAQVPTRDSLVALTFDDGPAGSVTESLIETLRSHRAQATFFVIGSEVEKAPAAAAALVAAGHELGNHSYSHQRMVLMRPNRIREEIARTDSLIRAAGERGPIYFRPPYGYKLVTLPWVLARTNRVSVMWSVEPDSYPDVAATADGIVKYVLGRVHPGSIVILHVWYPSRATSLAAVAPLIDSLHIRGYEGVTVGRLLSAGLPNELDSRR